MDALPRRVGRLDLQDRSSVQSSALRRMRSRYHWLLAILRFAVTLEQTDRATVVTIEMDGSGSRDQSAFAFFVRTSPRGSPSCVIILGELMTIAYGEHLSGFATNSLALPRHTNEDDR